MHYAQVLYHAGQFESAMSVAMTIERAEDEQQVGATHVPAGTQIHVSLLHAIHQ